MDVRCEKCQTEYELDETRLKPGGVTVKCTNCGYMFKIRKRSATAAGGSVPPTTRPKTPTARPATNTGDPMGGAEGERNWMLRLENGETKTCRELATLQQWIIARVVTRDSLISRNGKTWKRIGDIVELSSYFAISDEASQIKQTATPSGKVRVEDKGSTLLGVGQGAGSATNLPKAGGSLTDLDDESKPTGDYEPVKVKSPATATASGPTAAAPRIRPPTGSPLGGDTERNRSPSSPLGYLATIAPGAASVAAASSAVPPAPTDDDEGAGRDTARTVAPSVSARFALGDASPASDAAVTAPTGLPAGARAHDEPSFLKGSDEDAAAAPQHPSEPTISGPSRGVPQIRTTGGWSASIPPPMGGAPDPAFSGKPRLTHQTSDFSGKVRTAPSDDAVFDRSRRPSRADEEDDDIEALHVAAGSRAGKWIALVSLLVIAGAGAAIYFVFLRGKGGEHDTAVVAIDANPALAISPDAGAVTPPVAVADAGTAPVTASLDNALSELGSGVAARQAAAASALDGNDAPDAQAVRALLLLAQAQTLEDRAALVELGDKAAADKLRSDEKALVVAALPLAQKASKAAATSAAANVAMAEVLRLQGKSDRDVKKYLDVARKAEPQRVDVVLADALLLARAGKKADALAALTKFDSGAGALEKTGDVRVRVRRALLLLADGKRDDAKAAVDQVIAAQPEHEVAKAMAAILATAVAATDPLPPEDGVDAGAPSKPVDAGVGGSSTTPVVAGEDSYDKLVAKADAAAEVSCDKAMPLYQAALAKKSDGVEALTGQGYCFIDQSRFASAHSNFRAALAVSSRFEPALWGIAEAYQQQGLKDKAIEAYLHYIEVLPGRADKAKKQLQVLGYKEDGGGDDGGGDAPKDPPKEPTPETPAPAPDPAPTP